MPPLLTDLDGDGWPDLVGGQPGACVANCAQPASATYVNAVMAVWPGGPTGFPATPTFELWSPDRYRGVYPAAAVGDSDGDGVHEILFADPLASNGSREEGKVWLAAGGAGTLGPITWTAEAGAPSVNLGEVAEGTGDLNGDGYDDLVLGASRFDALLAFYGGPGGYRAAPDWLSGSLPDTARAIASGDVDGDGFPDVFVGAPDAPTGSGDGEVYGFRGGPGGLAAAPDWTLTHASVPGTTSFGDDLLVIPDVNGDGYAELAVSSPAFQVGNYNNGKVEVFAGGPSGPASVPTWTFVGPEENDALGRGLAVGDLDGDGLPDLLMGLLQRDWFTLGGDGDGVGGVLVALGVPGGFSATPAYVLRGPHGKACFDLGMSLSGGGGYDRVVQVADLDRDGRDDVVFACTNLLVDARSREGSIVIAYGGTDTDGDGVSDAMDCDASDPDIFPGAVEIGYDGVDQDCDGWDDFDLDLDGVQALPWGFDEDDRDSAITLSLTVGGSCASALDLAVDGATSGATVEFYAGIYAMNEGRFTAPHPCLEYGQGMNLREPELFLGSAVADGSGRAELTGVAAWATACTDHVQAIDLATCGKSTAHTTLP